MLEKVDTLVLDKTGTLTEGKPKVHSVITTTRNEKPSYCGWWRVWSSEANIRWARPSFARRKRMDSRCRSLDFHYLTGFGVSGKVDGKMCWWGMKLCFRAAR